MSISRRISVRLAIWALAAAVSLGLLISGGQILAEANEFRAQVRATTQGLLQLSYNAARSAVFELNPNAARDLAEGLVSHPYIAAARILDEFGAPLAQADTRQSATTQPRGVVANWLDLKLEYRLSLHQRVEGGRVFGELEVLLDESGIVNLFQTHALNILLVTLLRDLLLALLLTGVFFLILTRPLLKLISEVGDTDPTTSDTQPISLPHYHRHDELGTLVHTINRLREAIGRYRADRDRIEEQLRDSEKRHRDIAESTSDWFWETDAQHRFTYLSERISDAANIDVSKVLGITRWELGAINTDDVNWRAHRMVLEAHQSFREFVYELVDHSGRHQWFKVSGKPFFDKEGNFQGYRGTGTNVTSEVRMEQELIEAQKMEAIGTLASGIAHDFNNVLSAIVGNAEMVRLDAGNPSQVEFHVEQLLRACSRSKDLISQLLFLSRQQPQNRGEMQLGEVIRECMKFVRSSIPTTIDIEIDIRDEVSAYGDSTQIYQAILNLCTNASYAMKPSGGRLSISLSLLDQSSPRSDRREPLAHIQVSDTGPGIAEKDIPRVFEPFFTTKPLGEGTGLGLAMVKKIVETHGGIISINSTAGSGTTVNIYLPSSETPTVGAADHPPDQQVWFKGHVLLVDDEEELLRVGRRLLESMGLRVTTQQSPVDAVKLFESNPQDFQLVLTDQTMPRLTGLELGVRFHALRPDLPMLIYTGYSEALNDESARRCGFSELLHKPVSRELLIKSISRLLPATSSATG